MSDSPDGPAAEERSEAAPSLLQLAIAATDLHACFCFAAGAGARSSASRWYGLVERAGDMAPEKWAKMQKGPMMQLA